MADWIPKSAQTPASSTAAHTEADPVASRGERGEGAVTPAVSAAPRSPGTAASNATDPVAHQSKK